MNLAPKPDKNLTNLILQIRYMQVSPRLDYKTWTNLSRITLTGSTVVYTLATLLTDSLTPRHSAGQFGSELKIKLVTKSLVAIHGFRKAHDVIVFTLY